jgi:hypothetical protein
MNKFWQLVTRVRDFGHEMSLKQYGKDGAGSEYKFKLLAFISGYVLTLIFIFFQILFYFIGSNALPVNDSDSIPIKVLAAFLIIYLPIRISSRFLLKKVSHIPLPKEFKKEEYRQNLFIYFGLFLLGHVLWISIGIFFMSYLRGIQIN